MTTDPTGSDSFAVKESLLVGLEAPVVLPAELRTSTGMADLSADMAQPWPVDPEGEILVAAVRARLGRVEAAGAAQIRAVMSRFRPGEDLRPVVEREDEPAWVSKVRTRAHNIVDTATDAFVRGIS